MSSCFHAKFRGPRRTLEWNCPKCGTTQTDQFTTWWIVRCEHCHKAYGLKLAAYEFKDGESHAMPESFYIPRGLSMLVAVDRERNSVVVDCPEQST